MTQVRPAPDQKTRDLRTVLSVFPLQNLLALDLAISEGRVISGRFFDFEHPAHGCVFYHLSCQTIVDRSSGHQELEARAWGNADQVKQAARRLIVAFDQASPDAIVKGFGYESEYGQPVYSLTLAEVSIILADEIAQRRDVNLLEESQIAASCRQGV